MTSDDAPRFAYHVWRSNVWHMLTHPWFDDVDLRRTAEAFGGSPSESHFTGESSNALKFVGHVWTSFKTLTFYTLFYTALRFPWILYGFSMVSMVHGVDMFCCDFDSTGYDWVLVNGVSALKYGDLGHRLEEILQKLQTLGVSQ